MFSHRSQPLSGVAITPTTRESEARVTASRGAATDTSPDELAMLADQVAASRMSIPLRVQGAVDQVRSFMVGHVVTTAVAVALIAAAVLLLV